MEMEVMGRRFGALHALPRLLPAAMATIEGRTYYDGNSHLADYVAHG